MTARSADDGPPTVVVGEAPDVSGLKAPCAPERHDRAMRRAQIHHIESSLSVISDALASGAVTPARALCEHT